MIRTSSLRVGRVGHARVGGPGESRGPKRGVRDWSDLPEEVQGRPPVRPQSRLRGGRVPQVRHRLLRQPPGRHCDGSGRGQGGGGTRLMSLWWTV